MFSLLVRLVTDPLCYIDLTFVERPFAKLKYVNLLGTFVGLAFCIQARLSHVKSKNKQLNDDMTFPMVPHMHGWY